MTNKPKPSNAGQIVGSIMVISGLLPLVAAFIYFIWLWVAEIIPFFLSHGNPVPLILAVSIALLVGGSVIVSIYTPDKDKTS